MLFRLGFRKRWVFKNFISKINEAEYFYSFGSMKFFRCDIVKNSDTFVQCRFEMIHWKKRLVEYSIAFLIGCCSQLKILCNILLSKLLLQLIFSFSIRKDSHAVRDSEYISCIILNLWNRWRLLMRIECNVIMVNAVIDISNAWCITLDIYAPFVWD